MKTFNDGGSIGLAAMKAGMDRKTARRYLRRGAGPTTLKQTRHWQTHPDAFATIWPEVVRWLEDTPEIEAKALFEHYLAQRPEQLPANGLRTSPRTVAQPGSALIFATMDWRWKKSSLRTTLGDTSTWSLWASMVTACE